LQRARLDNFDRKIKEIKKNKFAKRKYPTFEWKKKIRHHQEMVDLYHEQIEIITGTKRILIGIKLLLPYNSKQGYRGLFGNLS
jgi:hypothetical protein